MTLVEAAAVFFPQGPLTLSSCERRQPLGLLKSRVVAGKDLTTPRAIRKLVKTVMPGRKASRLDSGSGKMTDPGSSSTAEAYRTGCAADDTDGAAKALEKYIGARHTPTIGDRSSSSQ